jgi:hypothetical protein
MQNSSSFKKNIRCLLGNNHLRKGFTRMMKYIIESKDNEEDNKRRNKEKFNNKIKGTMINQQLQEMIKYGIRFSLNKNLCQNQSLKNQIL